MRNISIDDYRQILPIGDCRYSLSEIEILCPIHISRYRVQVDDSVRLRARNHQSPDGGMDFSQYNYYSLTYIGDEESNSQSVINHKIIHDRVTFSHATKVYVAEVGRVIDVIAVYSGDLFVFSNNLKRVIRKKFGVISYLTSMKFIYSLVIEKIISDYGIHPPKIYCVKESKLSSIAKRMEVSRN